MVALGLLAGLTAVNASVVNKSAVNTRTTETAVPVIAHIQTNQSNQTSLHFTLTAPPPTVAEQGDVLSAGLTAQIQEPGAPALPHYAAYILLPPEATASIAVSASDAAVSAVGPIASVPQPANQVEEMTGVDAITAVSNPHNPLNAQPPTRVNAPDPAIYQQDALYPDALYSLSEPFYYRDLRLVELRLYPIRYNPAVGELHHVQQLDVAIQFEGAQWDDLRPAPTPDDAYLSAMSDAILNFDYAQEWRSLPANLLNAGATNFPVNAAETFKIELNQDGIYEVSYADLLAAGMDVANVNPAQIAMMHRGQPVAYQFIGDDNADFESGEAVRFYGWAFDGPRIDKQFIANNVFWLWADPTNTPTTILTTTNETGGTITTSAVMTVTREPENLFTSTYTNQWDSFPNQPDAWYWDYVKQGDLGTAVTQTYTITLPNPLLSSPEPAIYTVELLSRERSTDPTGITYNVTAYINDHPTGSTAVWDNAKSTNITDTIPANELRSQANEIHLVFASDSALAEIYLNRISVRYTSELTAVNDQLIFSDETGGSRKFQVGGFVEETASNVLVWNTTVPTSPIQIEMSAGDISGGVYSFGSSHAAGAEFIATTTANTRAVNAANITKYVPTSLEPSGSGADWIAISHADFIAQANRLASHRENTDFGGLTTKVVDYEDVVNQYGYGLPLPAAIHDYLAYALGNWSPAPAYTVLFGSATYNPRNLDCAHSTCPGGATTWDKDQPTFVVTDLVYEDRFQGLIPSDHTMTLLTGNDLVPDIAIGRITANTLAEAEAAVSKIILYEQSQLAGASWQNNLLFVADNADDGGNFYQENLTTVANHIPDSYNSSQLYLLTSDSAETAALRDAMLQDVNGDGVSILNYRGHGSVDQWASPAIISTTNQVDFWSNFDEPTVILSADCLDGNFAFPGIPALSKTLLTLSNGPTPVGSAAHWSSTGLGYTNEHSVLHRSFYDGLFDQNMKTIGEAVNHAKMMYDLGGYHESELYSFMLQGDPAMQLFRLRNQTYLPSILNK